MCIRDRTATCDSSDPAANRIVRYNAPPPQSSSDPPCLLGSESSRRRDSSMKGHSRGRGCVGRE
eukprot:14893411-Alexandrium_andersonii.AAC.1